METRQSVQSEAAEQAESPPEQETSQQTDAVVKQLEKEEAKHRERVTRLQRIRELLLEKGDQKGVDRVDKLTQREKNRHHNKANRLRGNSKTAAGRFEDRMRKLEEKRGQSEKSNLGQK
ncbi:MAG: hypothetical protein ABIG68_14200 [Acidobacteriota bacterium]